MQRIRVASLQYLMRPVGRFEDFQNQVSALVETARDYKCRLMVFPEYFTVQLLTLNDVRRPIHEQVPALASQLPRFLEMMSALSRKHGIYIVGGSIPVSDEESPDKVYNQSYLFSPSGEYDYQGKLHMTGGRPKNGTSLPGIV